MSDKLTGEQRAKAERAIRQRLWIEPMTFTEAFVAANEALGFPPAAHNTPCYRFADRFLQKLRKTGEAKPIRSGRTTYWSAQASFQEPHP